MVDMAELGFRVDSKEVKTATGALGQMADAADKAANSSEKVGNSADKAAPKVGLLARAKQDLRKAAMAGAAATTAATAAIVALTAKGLNAVDAQAKLARSLDASADAVRAVQLAASEAGLDNMEASLVRLNRRLGAAEMGNLEYNKAVEALNLNLRELSRMDVDQRVAALADAVRDSGLSAQVTARHIQTLGFNQANANDFFRAGGDAVRGARQAVSDYGLSINEIDSRVIESANDAWARTQLVTEGVQNNLARAFAPILLHVSNSLNEAATGANWFADAADVAANVAVRSFGFVADIADMIRRQFLVVGNGAAMMGHAIRIAALEAANYIISGPNRAINRLIELINMLPGMDLGPVGADTIQNFQSKIDESKAAIRIGVDEIQKILMEPVPSVGIMTALEESTRAARESASQAIVTRDEQRELSHAMLDYAGAAEVAKGDTDALAKAQEEAQREAERFRSSLDSLLRTLDPVAAATADFMENVDLLDRAWVEGHISGERYEELMLSLATGTEEVAKKTKEAAQEAGPFATAWQESLKRLDGAFAGIWTGAFDSFRDFRRNLFSSFKQMLGEMAHAAVTRPIMLSIGGAGSVIPGQALASGAMGGGGGLDISSLGSMINAATGGYAGLLSSLGGLTTSIGGVVSSGLISGIGTGMSMAAANIGAAGFVASMGANMSLAASSLAAGAYGTAIGAAIPVIGPIIVAAGIIASMWGKRKTTGQGLDLGVTAGDLDANQFELSRRSGISRIRGSGKKELIDPLDEEAQAAISGLLDSVMDGITAAAKTLGTDASEIIANTTIEAVRVDLLGKSEEEIQEAISEWAMSVGDTITGAIFDGLSMERVGELAGALEVVNAVLGAIGQSSLEASIQGAEAAEAMITAAGGVEAMIAAAGSYAEMVEQEGAKTQLLFDAMRLVMESVNLEIPETIAQFQEIVLAQDLMTEEGRATHTALMSIAGAFTEVRRDIEEMLQISVDSISTMLRDILYSAETEAEARRMAEEQAIAMLYDGLSNTLLNSVSRIMIDGITGQMMPALLGGSTTAGATMAAGGAAGGGAVAEGGLIAGDALAEIVGRAVSTVETMTAIMASAEFQSAMESIGVAMGSITANLHGAGVGATQRAAAQAAATPPPRYVPPPPPPPRVIAPMVPETPVSTALEDVNAILQKIGRTALETGDAGLRSAEAMIEAAGGLDKLSLQHTEYAALLSQQATDYHAMFANFGESMAAIGEGMPETVGQFVALVEAQNLMTEEGQETYSVLMSVVGAFIEIRAGVQEMMQVSADSIAGILRDVLSNATSEAEARRMAEEQSIASLYDGLTNSLLNSVSQIMLDGIIGQMLPSLVGGSVTAGSAMATGGTMGGSAVATGGSIGGSAVAEGGVIAGSALAGIVDKAISTINAMVAIMGSEEFQAAVGQVGAAMGDVAGHMYTSGVGSQWRPPQVATVHSTTTQRAAPSATPSGPPAYLSILERLYKDTAEAAKNLAQMDMSGYERAMDNIERGSADWIKELTEAGYNTEKAVQLVGHWAEVQRDLVEQGNARQAAELVRGLGESLQELWQGNDYERQLQGIAEQSAKYLKSLEDIGQATEENAAAIDLWARAQRAAIVVSHTMGQVESAVAEARQRAIDAANAEIEGVNEWMSVTIEAHQLAMDAAVESLRAVNAEYSGIQSARARLREGFEPGQVARRDAALATLSRAILTGDMTGAGDAAGIASAIAEGSFGSAAELRAEQARTLYLLAVAEEMAGEQVDAGQAAVERLDGLIEETRASADAQIAAINFALDEETLRLDGVIEAARAQIDALYGIDNSVLSVEDAVSSLSLAIRDAQAMQAEADSAGLHSIAVGTDGIAAAIRDSNIALEAIHAAIVDAGGAGGSGAVTAQVTAGRTTLHSSLYDEELRRLSTFANGGSHMGGLRIVGERGPELEATGPSRIMSNEKLMSAMGGSAELRREMKGLRADLKAANHAIEANGREVRRILDRWDRTGIPEEREII